jgi:hypothetical protein
LDCATPASLSSTSWTRYCLGWTSLFDNLDDILISSSSTEEHLHHLHLVLQRLQEYGLVLNITADGVSPILKHIQAIQDFPATQDKKQLQTFLGMVNVIGGSSQRRRTSSSL